MTLKTKVLAVRETEELVIGTGLTKAEAADMVKDMCATDGTAGRVRAAQRS